MRQRYCIVSHLEDKTKCFHCDSRQSWQANREPHRNSHRIENVVTENYEDRTKNWWQSENGIQNVSVRVDFEAEFHFTHLIMTFRSFRPAAMLIERSADFGKTWNVYRYFAYDCANTYPGIPEGPPKNHSDVICTRKYSDVAPSTGGELVYKVISPHIRTENPYADEISNLLKVTNLRINFTKLHTLGDDLLDYRPEIDEKYYYAVYEIVVRGSCSCYGHAQRCIPIGDEGVGVANLPDMVHGRCECTHNTKGLNCEQCMDFFNDLPWRPAFGDQPNECRPCNCNGHASRCHFDQAVYNASGFVSGGVCDDCMHNTQGKNCEQCKPYFYRDPSRPIHDPHVCRPCQCDKRGSTSDGICEGEEDPSRGLVAGKCYCKTNVDGPYCDRCKNGFWDLRAEDPDGCKQCTCNLLGTWNNEGCNKYDGTCTCKRLVTGENCDKCLPEHYGLSDDLEGCKACDCDLGGAFNNNCDIITGQCKCRENFGGRRCDSTDSSYYCANIDHYTYEAEYATLYDADIETRESGGRPRTWTGEGFARIREKSNITFIVDNLQKSTDYNIVFRYELDDNAGWQDIQISVVRPGDPSPDGPCANIAPSDDFLIARLHPGYRYSEVHPTVCLEAGVRYEIRVYFGDKFSGHSNSYASALIDSIVLVPPTDALDIFIGSQAADFRKQQYDRYQCRAQALALTPLENLSQECVRFICPVAAVIFDRGLECDCDPTGSVSGICRATGGQCECKPNVVGRRCDKCAVGTYGFGPTGCTSCDCDSVGALSNACDKQSGQCECRDRGITGRQCNQCQPGFWSFPDCRTCQCNGHASICDQKTGACIDCRNLTDGSYCERCQSGYYGDPRLGVNLPCKPCPCPGGPGSGFQHADTCYLKPSHDYRSQDIVCNCRNGYTGERCDQCALNFWGNPQEIGGSCERCDCNDNIDRTIEGSCDAKVGDCLKCLHNTEGAQCEHCKEGFYGDAKIRTCQRCVCNPLGTNSSAGACDRITGQCPCYPNVIGQACDECAPHHYNIASNNGCSACACDPTGVILGHDGNPRLECNHIDGQCHCKAGRGGRTCSECQDLYWGDPVGGECVRCQCDTYGAATQQCHRNNGTCICRPGSGGPLCNECARGYTGRWPQCEACGECFDNWDRILQTLKHELDTLIDRANNIEDTGISSEYDDRFEQMEGKIAEVRKKLESVNITKDDIDNLRKQMENLQSEIDAARARLAEKNKRVSQISTKVDLAEEEVRNLNETAKTLTQLADTLNQNATQIQQSDINGATRIIKNSAEKSKNAKIDILREMDKINAAETVRNKADQLLKEHQNDFEIQYSENQKALQDIGVTISTLEKSLPFLNKQVCGAESAPCDTMCGGPGSRCSHCGGHSCPGSVSKAKQALEFAKEAEAKVEAKQKEAEELLKRVRDSTPFVVSAKRESDSALDMVSSTAQQANKTRQDLEKQIQEIHDFLNSERATPDDVRSLVEQVLNITIPFDEKQIQELAEKIREKVLQTQDIDKILEETRGNKTTAAALQASAERASQRAASIHNLTLAIRDALDQAKAAQDAAQQTLNEANEKISQSRQDLSLTDDQVAALEQKAKDANSRLQQLRNTTDNLKAEYIKITSASKSASQSANNATDIAKEVDSKHTQLEETYTRVKAKLDERENGNEDRNTKASALRKKTTELLAKIKRHNEDIESLKKGADSLDVELGDFRKQISSLSDQIDRVTKDIERLVLYHATCDA
uniref:Laminin subunit beta-1 n=1 Tax=Acrobeloides nanus TaxID=290746 RepID=A0A914C176_9BILA